MAVLGGLLITSAIVGGPMLLNLTWKMVADSVQNKFEVLES